MRLYVVGGGGCMIRILENMTKSRVTIVRDICATAKAEAMTVRKIPEKRRGCLYEKRTENHQHKYPFESL